MFKEQFEKELERLEQKFESVLSFISKCKGVDEALQKVKDEERDLRRALILYFVRILQTYLMSNKKDNLSYLISGYLMGLGGELAEVIDVLEEKIKRGGIDVEIFSGLVKYAVNVLLEQNEEIKKQFILH